MGLRSVHNRLNSRIHRRLKLASSQSCPCDQKVQATELVLQRCPLHIAAREDVWPVSTPLTTTKPDISKPFLTRLYSSKQKLGKTTSFISRAALIASPARRREEETRGSLSVFPGTVMPDLNIDTLVAVLPGVTGSVLLLRTRLYIWGSPFRMRFLRMWPFF